MAEDQTEKDSWLKRARRWYRYVSDILTPARILLLLGALAVGIVGLFGGWGVEDSGERNLSTATVGEPIDTKPFQITATRARYLNEFDYVLPAEDGYRYIVLMMDVENVTDSFVSSMVLTDSIRISAEGLRMWETDGDSIPVRPMVIRTADSLNQYDFQPGLPTNVILVWQQETDVDVPAELTVTFSTNTWRRSTFDGRMGWRDPEPAFEAVLPLDAVED